MWKLTPEERLEGIVDVELSTYNKEIMAKFKEFVKYNPFLIHLDLQQTGMMVPAIKEIGNLLTRAQSLRCIHLCGNDGVTDDTIEWLLNRIKGKRPVVSNDIKAPPKPR